MSYFSNLLSSTTSRYTALRRTLLSSTAEDDSSIDDPESSHVSRVLRAYYTEKNRPFPPWLGPDPRSASQGHQQQQSFAGSATGSLRGHSSTNRNSGEPSSGGLGDLWADDAGAERNPEEAGSLRRGLRARPGIRGEKLPQTQSGDGFNGRPLPSQRDGSYQGQSRGSGHSQPQAPERDMSPAPPNSAGSGSLQERLKARLGGRSGATPSPPSRSYDGRGSSEGGAGGVRYDDRASPGHSGSIGSWSGGSR